MVVQARRILIGFDGSAASWRALDVAAGMIGYGSTLAVVSVGTEQNGGVRALLERARERLLGHQVTATYIEKVGAPAEQLVAAARELDTDLVVVGRRSATGGDVPQPGSVSEGVMRDAPCDVLVIR
jgi:nucleotide-binding universal stress UspA family protein